LPRGEKGPLRIKNPGAKTPQKVRPGKGLCDEGPPESPSHREREARARTENGPCEECGEKNPVRGKTQMARTPQKGKGGTPVRKAWGHGKEKGKTTENSSKGEGQGGGCEKGLAPNDAAWAQKSAQSYKGKTAICQKGIEESRAGGTKKKKKKGGLQKTTTSVRRKKLKKGLPFPQKKRGGITQGGERSLRKRAPRRVTRKEEKKRTARVRCYQAESTQNGWAKEKRKKKPGQIVWHKRY